MKTKIIEFENEKSEVIDSNLKPQQIGENYKYINNNFFFKLRSFLTYRLILTPYAYFHFKVFNGVKFKNTQVLKLIKNQSYFVYSNHTNFTLDAFCPTLICKGKKPHIIIDSKNLSLPFLGKRLKMWGGIPLPDDLKSTRNFNNALKIVLEKKNPIIIYPEAHVWPYYTQIREFEDTSFRYPVIMNKPVFVFTTTYQKKKHYKKPKVTIYVDGPFYPNQNLERKEAQIELRNQVLSVMQERSKLSNYEFYVYKHKKI